MSTEINMPVAKAASSLGVAAAAQADVATQLANHIAVGMSSPFWIVVMMIPWGLIASVIATTYTFLLLTEWWWKRLWRPLFERRGWIKPRKRYIITPDDIARMQAGETMPADL